MKRFLLRLPADAAGVDLVEYALLAGFITLVGAVGFSLTGGSIASLLGSLGGYLGTLTFPREGGSHESHRYDASVAEVGDGANRLPAPSLGAAQLRPSRSSPTHHAVVELNTSRRNCIHREDRKAANSACFAVEVWRESCDMAEACGYPQLQPPR